MFVRCPSVALRKYVRNGPPTSCSTSASVRIVHVRGYWFGEYCVVVGTSLGEHATKINPLGVAADAGVACVTTTGSANPATDSNKTINRRRILTAAHRTRTPCTTNRGVPYSLA